MSILYLKFKSGQEMRPISLTININSKTIILPIAILVAVIGGKNIKDSYAQTAANPFTGSCGLILNRNFGGWDAYYQGNTTIAQNFIGTINFDTGYSGLLVNTGSGYGTNKATEQQQVFTDNQKFSITSGPVNGSYYLSALGINKVSYIFVPVNGGNTFLVTELNSSKPSSTGVCQRI
jgi:hypothetical protein